MKYALILVVALILLRIDMFVGVVERGWKKIPSFKSGPQLEDQVQSPAPSASAFGELKLNEVSQLQVLLAEFSLNPDRASRELITGFLAQHSALQLVSVTLLFTEMDKWIPHIREDNAELPLLLNDLLSVFKGERAQVVSQFYAKYFDDNPELFFHYYPLARDPSCIVIKNAWNSQNILTKEQVLTRKKQVEQLLGKIAPEKLEFAKNCQLVLRVEESKNTPNLESI